MYNMENLKKFEIFVNERYRIINEGVDTIDVDRIDPHQKDIDRAEGLKYMRGAYQGDDLPFRSNASKMSKLIKDPFKLVRRAKAVARRYGTYDYFPDVVPEGRRLRNREYDVWTPFAEALENMGFTYEQIRKIGLGNYQGFDEYEEWDDEWEY